jgi:hypothetical protein
MPKSEFKLLIAEVAPHCIQTLDNCPIEYPVVVDDIIVKLTAFMLALTKDTSRRSINDIVRSVYAPIVRASVSKPCYVLVIDKYSHVTKAKQAEQRSRDQQRDKDAKKAFATSSVQDRLCETEALSYMTSFADLVTQTTPTKSHVAPCHTNNPNAEPTPNRTPDLIMTGCAWRKSFTSDRNFKRFVVALITERASILLPEMMKHANLPASHCIILDGEHLDGTPFISVCRSGARSHIDDDLERTLVNSLGEFDVAHVHHLLNPTLQSLVNKAHDGAFLVVSVDTDILVINAMRSTHPLYTPQVRIAMGLPKKTNLASVPVQPGATYYFDPRAVRAWGDQTLGATIDGFDGLVAAFHLAGSDFNHQGIPGLGNLTVLKEFIVWAVQNPTKRIDEFYAHKLRQQNLKYSRIVNASQRTKDLKRKCDQLQRHSKQPLRRVQWVKEDYWSGRNTQSPIGQGYEIDASDDKGRLCFAEELDQFK